jgi:hypothetical protein
MVTRSISQSSKRPDTTPPVPNVLESVVQHWREQPEESKRLPHPHADGRRIRRPEHAQGRTIRTPTMPDLADSLVPLKDLLAHLS